MSFNIEWGGTNVSFDKVVEAIRVSDADIVGVQEAEGNLVRLAGALGWYYDERNYVVSRFPVLDPPGAGGRYAYVEVRPGEVVAIANVHLPSDPYGPDLVKAGATLDEVLETERRTRLPGIEAVLEAIEPLDAHGMPVFITGDFNTPAHTDWTEATAGTRRYLRYPVAWPVSLAVADAGFSDAWRSVHMDPVESPGLTWWAARPPLEAYSPGENDPQDRIDFIWFAGSADAISSILVGESQGPEVSIGLAPWPSDHRAVLARFSVRPAALPRLATTDRRVYRKGDEIGIIFNTADAAAIRITTEAAKGGEAVVAERDVSGRSRLGLDSATLSPGHYELHLSGDAAPAREFWILERDSVAAVETDGVQFAPGEGIGIRWANAPGHRNDYVAVYDSQTPAGYGSGLAWAYVDARPAGALRLDVETAQGPWPLVPGSYVIRLMKDDGYEQLAESAPFAVSQGATDNGPNAAAEKNHARETL